MFKLAILIVAFIVLITEGFWPAMAFIGLCMVLAPVVLICMGAVAYAGIVQNARNNSKDWS
ncbi:hypothetical protein HOR97_gp50 [Agrobacterium phage Atu_ph03]|uniref:Uncharacterized protein n=1 Tax=Agrobacterium phage Atu_ph03 TaxID=2024262 RepID=A0A2L0UZ40_9CAUD|nr:hypothetical protein HOR97_gp50 [Agrobacterium phage Atu_ph03]AUZ94798.1 hypothetical protein [Agrobacterium phage Atu_ph03]